MRYGWSIERDHWDDIPKEALKSDKWRSVNVSSLERNRVPESPGVYLFCSNPPGRSRKKKVKDTDLFGVLYNVLYVGKATNLRTRFLSHCNNPAEDILKSRACFPEGLEFWFMSLSKDQIDATESVLIRCFGPPANRVSGIKTRIVGGKAIT